MSILTRLGVCFSAAACAAALIGPARAQSPGIVGIIAPEAQVELVREGFVFTEGPVGAEDGGLYFSDIRPNKTYHLDLEGKLTVVREGTGGGNGLALTPNGELLTAEGDTKRITRRGEDGGITVLVDRIDDKPLIAPNDLIPDAKGGIYFTDPGPRPVVPSRPTYVGYLAPDAKQAIIIDGAVARPNGLTLTHDGKTLIVDDTIGPEIFAYDVQADGRVVNKRVFARLQDIPQGKESGADGLAIDNADRIYVSTITGVQIFDAKGEYLGTIAVPRQPANVAFGGPDKQTLYITAREGLYRVRLLARGPDRMGK
jgi:gluconolactonase